MPFIPIWSFPYETIPLISKTVMRTRWASQPQMPLLGLPGFLCPVSGGRMCVWPSNILHVKPSVIAPVLEKQDTEWSFSLTFSSALWLLPTRFLLFLYFSLCYFYSQVTLAMMANGYILGRHIA